MPRILTAVSPDAEERVRRILTGHELVFVGDLAAAKEALQNEGMRLIFVGIRFDESRMFELLEYLQKDARHKKIPIVAAIVGPTTMSKQTVKGLGDTTKLFGASVFINLNDFPDDDTENTRLRIIVEALLLPPGAVPVVAGNLGSANLEYVTGLKLPFRQLSDEEYRKLKAQEKMKYLDAMLEDAKQKMAEVRAPTPEKKPAPGGP